MLIQTQHLGGVKAVLQESPPRVAGTLEGGDRPPTPTLAPSLAGVGREVANRLQAQRQLLWVESSLHSTWTRPISQMKNSRLREARSLSQW